MPKVICTLPNASGVINGVNFVTHKLGMISEEVADDVADHFLKIKGYAAVPAQKAAGSPVPPVPPAPPVPLVPPVPPVPPVPGAAEVAAAAAAATTKA